MVLVDLDRARPLRTVLMVVLHYCHILTLVIIRLDLVEVVVDMVILAPTLVKMVDLVMVEVAVVLAKLVEQIQTDLVVMDCKF